MRHRVRSRTLGRMTGHRLSMLRNLATALLEHKQIDTTELRAKEVQRYVEPIIEAAKNALKNEGQPAKALAYKRQIFAKVYSRKDVDNPTKAARDRHAANELLLVARRYLAEGARAERKGGYTRITRLANRKGDGALIVTLSLVD
ncbi:MAG: 50S ribosomal protein L17 [Candidatus Xenobia bacterium]